MNEFVEKLRSLVFRPRPAGPKVTHVSAEETGAESATITETDTAVSVNITPPTLHLGAEGRSPDGC